MQTFIVKELPDEIVRQVNIAGGDLLRVYTAEQMLLVYAIKESRGRKHILDCYRSINASEETQRLLKTEMWRLQRIGYMKRWAGQKGAMALTVAGAEHAVAMGWIETKDAMGIQGFVPKLVWRIIKKLKIASANDIAAHEINIHTVRGALCRLEEEGLIRRRDIMRGREVTYEVSSKVPSMELSGSKSQSPSP